MRTTLRSVAVLLAVTALAASCKSAPRASAGNMNPTLLTQADIERGQSEGVRDLHELISRMRPRWMDVRQDRSLRLATQIVVYQNNSRLGSVEALRGYPLANITSVRYLDAAQAGLLPGAAGGHIEGAIVISTNNK
jgi:hypothetical protein